MYVNCTDAIFLPLKGDERLCLVLPVLNYVVVLAGGDSISGLLYQSFFKSQLDLKFS